MRDKQIRELLDGLADDVGRLRRRLDADSSLVHVADRMAWWVETVDAITHPSAADLACEVAPGDEAAISEALRIVDERAANLRYRMRPAA